MFDIVFNFYFIFLKSCLILSQLSAPSSFWVLVLKAVPEVGALCGMGLRWDQSLVGYSHHLYVTLTEVYPLSRMDDYK